jgi:DNA helicase-2/ATP-dependent DNA helicase PcrA
VTQHDHKPAAQDADDPELARVVEEEARCLQRVAKLLQGRSSPPEAPRSVDYDKDLLELRDQIASARLEDVPPLLAHMARLQSLAARQREPSSGGVVDPRSPYFGRLVLREGDRQREVLIGRGTYLDTDSGLRIVDWREAPVSRLYYRYQEGDEYDEVFGDREVEGEVVTRRTVTIVDGQLRRVSAPQGSFARSQSGGWRRVDLERAHLQGGQGTASRAEHHHRPGKLGIRPDSEGREDKHLREITALIDPQQFDLITQPDSGLVVIQGGAGSGKTTIGLHRLAYLAYQDPRRFRPDRMLVVVFNQALAHYMSMVLPALDVAGVGIRTYEDWASVQRIGNLPGLPRHYSEETPSAVTRLKKHPAMLHAIDAQVDVLECGIERQLVGALDQTGPATPRGFEQRLRQAWHASAGRPVLHRLHDFARWTQRASQPGLAVHTQVALERTIAAATGRARDVVTAWSELLSDRAALGRLAQAYAPGEFSEGALNRAHAWCSARCAQVVLELEEAVPARNRPRARRPSDPPHPPANGEPPLGYGVDGRGLEEATTLDREDDALLLRLLQKLRGPLLRGKDALVYQHLFVDEAQDLSPVELAVVLDTVSEARCVTLAGDTAQRLHMDNGFTDWQRLLADLGLAQIQIEPLQLSYRSTQQIIDFASTVLGPLAPRAGGVATRSGAPVQIISFAHSGDTLGFLAEALRAVMQEEPLASVAVIARYPEQADVYYQGLQQGEVPYLRRIAEQDFPFRPGIDVTDVRQVKGLEFDYVILVEVSEESYPVDPEPRHLLHIAATRAAHQLWVLTTGRPSPLLPDDLGDRGL